MHFTGTKSSPQILLLLKYKKCSARKALLLISYSINTVHFHSLYIMSYQYAKFKEKLSVGTDVSTPLPCRVYKKSTSFSKKRAVVHKKLAVKRPKSKRP